MARTTADRIPRSTVAGERDTSVTPMKGVAAEPLNVDDLLAMRRPLPITDLGFARVDHDRWIRQRQPEFVYAPGKTTRQMMAIVIALLDEGEASVVVTRLTVDQARSLRRLAERRGLVADWHAGTGLLTIPRTVPTARGELLILTAGTADLPVAQEAEVVARLLGARTQLVADVGVAGLHRLLAQLPAIEGADAVIVVAGMEGALASVVGGLSGVPVIACPTSVGYGANFEGITALLGMMSSCAPGVAVVNIDDGVGAGTIGALIARGRDG